ncbi:hypothetical protein FHG87_010904 [Trinorchestia longiramus]|nr:hypothetical protein FHG87_010904 [Trinorchestia longiramus]
MELALFLQKHQHCHADCFNNSEFILILVYLADIFAALNHLNQKIQGGGVNIIEAEENLRDFEKELPLWKRRTENNNFANFPLLDDCVKPGSTTPQNNNAFRSAGDAATVVEWSAARVLYRVSACAERLRAGSKPGNEYELFLVSRREFALIDCLFVYLTFWCQKIVTYPVIAKKDLEIFIPFVTTYLCEQSFSRMLDIKTKKRNRLCCENDLRVALAEVKPCIFELVFQRQQQKSH